MLIALGKYQNIITINATDLTTTLGFSDGVADCTLIFKLEVKNTFIAENYCKMKKLIFSKILEHC